MAIDLDFLNPSYKPALLAVSSPDVLVHCKDVLRELNYKILVANGHQDFAARFNNIQFNLVIIEELFGALAPEENTSLREFQQMVMSQRRHAIIVLLGRSVQTLNSLH